MQNIKKDSRGITPDTEIFFTGEWSKYLRSFDDRRNDIYFTEEYVKLYENDKDKAECFVYREGADILLFPYLKRRVDIIDGKYFDFETPYGYGGPITNSDDQDFAIRAVEAFGAGARANNIIAGMVRFHPLLGNHKIFADKYEVIFDRYTVSMDLRPDPSQIWEKQVHSKHRNSINKAVKSGITYSVDSAMEHMKVFVELYRATMSRIGADRFYFFSDAYFEDMKILRDNAFLGLVYLGDKIIAGAIFLRDSVSGHYHLAGSLDGYEQYNPNNFLIYNTAIHMKKLGLERFHLGGGSDRSPENSLFKFKSRFSGERHKFMFGKVVINEQMYLQACDSWDNARRGLKDGYKDYILKYRY